MKRLKEQLKEKEQEFNELKKFSEIQLEKFNSIKDRFENILKKYGVNEFDYDNSFIGTFTKILLEKIKNENNKQLEVYFTITKF
jgi:hypothetical protein